FGGATTAITYTAQIGHYMKIGNRVHVQGVLMLSSKGSATGTADIAGLPFNTANVGNYFAVFTPYVNAVNQNGPWQVGANANATTMFVQYLLGGAVGNADNTTFNNTSSLFFSGMYECTG